MTENNLHVMQDYFTAWRARDFAALSGLVAKDIEFSSALGRVNNREDFINGMRANLELIHDVTVLKMVAEGPDVITWFEIDTGTNRLPAANLSTIRDGKVVKAQAAFDTATMRPH